VRTALSTYIDAVLAYSTANSKPSQHGHRDVQGHVTIRKVSRKADELKTVVTGSRVRRWDARSPPTRAGRGRPAAGQGRSRRLATGRRQPPDGPSVGHRRELYRSKGARLSTILSGACTDARVPRASGQSANAGQGSAKLNGDETAAPVDQLGSRARLRRSAA